MSTGAARLVVAGLGYTGVAVAALAGAAGFSVAGTRREVPAETGAAGRGIVRFDDAGPLIAAATHLLVTAAPDAAGDPVLARHAEAIAAAPALRWIGYFSTTGVYGDRGGGWVDESTPPAPGSDRARRRVAAEAGWAALAGPGRAVDLMRLAGIYGPGRSALDELRAGTSRPVHAPGHRFGRIHRDDVAGATLAAIATARAGAVRVLNFSDAEPAESAAVVAEAARLLGLDPPPARPLDDAWADMSPMARSFWAENRRVSSRATEASIGRRWAHPSYREGLRAILAAGG